MCPDTVCNDLILENVGFQAAATGMTQLSIEFVCIAGEDVALGAPVEYIQLKGTTYDAPAVCKYTGNKYYSDDWMHHTGGH